MRVFLTVKADLLLFTNNEFDLVLHLGEVLGISYFAALVSSTS